MYEHVHISTSIEKLQAAKGAGGVTIPSVNLPPIVTCRQDAPCAVKCYARKGRFSFSHNKELLERNLAIWKADPIGYERDVKIAAFHTRFFRWHSSGDIVDLAYLHMMVRIAKELPHTSFLCFTKKYELVNTYLNSGFGFPGNLHIVLSAWGDWLPENPYDLPVAYIRFKKQDTNIPAHAKQCPKFCGDCIMTGCSCWDLNHGEAVVFNEH